MYEISEDTTPIEGGAKAGIIIAAVNIFLTVLMYVIDPVLLANWWISLIILVINFTLVIVLGKSYRNAVGGYLNFGHAYLHGFTTLLVASLIGAVFNILLYTVIDPELHNIVAEASIEKTAAFMRDLGASDAEIDEAIAGLKEGMPEKFTIAGAINQLGVGIIISAIVALVTGLVVKKNEPVDYV